MNSTLQAGINSLSRSRHSFLNISKSLPVNSDLSTKCNNYANYICSVFVCLRKEHTEVYIHAHGYYTRYVYLVTYVATDYG